MLKVRKIYDDGTIEFETSDVEDLSLLAPIFAKIRTFVSVQTEEGSKVAVIEQVKDYNVVFKAKARLFDD